MVDRPAYSVTRQLWLELPPISKTAPSRLLVFLHGAGSTPEAFAPIAIAWQLKFPGAHAIILQGLEPARLVPGNEWFDHSAPLETRRALIKQAAAEITTRIHMLQQQFSVAPNRTVLVGFSQGATLALEICRQQQSPADIVVSYAGKLSRPIAPNEKISANIHLIHGQLDSWVPVVFAQQALRGLTAAGASVTLDITEDGYHSIGTDMIIIGTTRALQTVFRGRSPPIKAVSRRTRTLH